jgi:uncharacterized protein (TIRG00374 family)
MKKKALSPKNIWNFFKIILALVLVWFIISKTNLNEILGLFKHISPTWFIISFFCFCLMTMMKAVQYYILTGRQVPYPRVLSIIVTQNVITNFIATGAGIASYLTMYTVDEGVKPQKAAATFIAAKIGDLIAVSLMLLVVSLMLWNSINPLRASVIAVLVTIALAIIVFVSTIVQRQLFLKVINAIAIRLRLIRFSAFQRGLETLQFLTEQDTGRVFALLQTSIICSLFYMFFTMLWVYSNLRAYSMVIPIPIVIFANCWNQLISWLPLQVFGGLGVTETSQVYFYSLFGIPVLQMATVTIGLRASLYLFNLTSLLYLPSQNLFRRKYPQAQSSTDRSK